MITARNVTDFFLSLCEPDAGDTISNLKMQKLLYYAQGFHLALYNKPLFSEKIIAWQYGPVVKEVYEAYSEYSYGSIPKLEKPVTLTTFSRNILTISGRS